MKNVPSVVPCAAVLVLSISALPSALQGEKAKASATVEGSFVDKHGEPVSGVRVLSRIRPGAAFLSESDAAGRFEVSLEWEADGRGTWYGGHATKKGYALREFRTELRDGQEFDFGRLQLDPGGVLTGTVVDESGGPLSQVMLLVVSAVEQAPPHEGKQEDGPGWEKVVGTGGTGDDGRFEIVGVPPGEWFVSAKHESTWWRSSSPVALKAGDSVEIPSLQLEPLPEECRIEGRVLGPSGEPIPGAEVITSVPSPGDFSSIQTTAQTDASGSFVLFLFRLPDGPVDLRIRPPADDLIGRSVKGVEPGARDVIVHLGGTRELRLHVVDAQGDPVERYGWAVSVGEPVSFMTPGTRAGFHEGGYATLRVPERPFELEIRSDAHERKWAGEFTPDALPDVVEVTLTSLPGVSGHVTFEGRAVPGAFVELVQRTPNFLEGVVEGHWDGLYYGSKASNVLSDEDGAFRVPNDFPHLTYYVRAWAEGYAEGMSGPVKVGASGIHVELGEGGRVAGVVRVPRELPAGNIELEFYREQVDPVGLDSSFGKTFFTKTDEDGALAQPHLAPGEWLVRVVPSGTLISDLGWSQAKIEAESHPHVVTVKEGETTHFDPTLGRDEVCVLEGRLSVGDEIREGYAKLMLERPLALDLDLASLEDGGRFRLIAREPGIYRLVVDAGPGHHSYKSVTDLVELVPGANKWERDLPVVFWQGEGVRLDRP